MHTLDDSAADIAILSPGDYHLLVGPALKVTADMAAQRGDPTLCNDMACMLALLAIVRALGDYHRARGQMTASLETLHQAPLGACAMVLQEADLSKAQKQECLRALERAEAQLRQEGGVTVDKALVGDAYANLAAGQRTDGERMLSEATKKLVDAIDTWESQRG